MADYVFPGEHVYDGMVLEGMVTEDALERMKDIEAVEGDILIATYPKTGTTVMEELSWLISTEGDFECASTVPLHKRMLYIEATFDGVNKNIDLLSQMPRPTIMKTHLPGRYFKKPIEQGKLKVVVMIRNPKDTLVSFYHFYRMNKHLANFPGTWDEFFELCQAKRLLYGDFFDWYSDWIPFLDKPNVELYKFEDIVKRRSSVVSQLSEFLGKSLSENDVTKIVEHTSFTCMKNNIMTNHEDVDFLDGSVSPFLRKGQVGDWKNYFTFEQSAIIEQAYSNFMKNGGPPLEFE